MWEKRNSIKNDFPAHKNICKVVMIGDNIAPFNKWGGSGELYHQKLSRYAKLHVPSKLPLFVIKCLYKGLFLIRNAFSVFHSTLFSLVFTQEQLQLWSPVLLQWLDSEQRYWEIKTLCQDTQADRRAETVDCQVWQCSKVGTEHQQHP